MTLKTKMSDFDSWLDVYFYQRGYDFIPHVDCSFQSYRFPNFKVYFKHNETYDRDELRNIHGLIWNK